MGSSTVHTIFMARPDEEEMELFWKLYYAAQRVEDRWHHNTVGPIADELSHCPNLTRQEKMFLLRAWQVLVDGIGGFGRFMGAFDTYVHNMQDPGVGHVAYKPSLIEMFGNAELLPVVIEAYQEALTALVQVEQKPPQPIIPAIGSTEVNDAAWKLHDMLTEHGPLNGHQFNNLKGYFYEALKTCFKVEEA
ncbi:hypothetical protein RDT67_25265 [Serratia fonticola]|uniref:Uncharacterized protein n=1 Tax=Serratia fonticola TaxID=47917 RepID=A0AAJ2DDE3_SERFO|nr:hypothetical protein [Serratia fonticola]MDQ9129731.1 hypothetical protein [Serratia fonticola]